MSNKQFLFLIWFFSGNFFSALKDEILEDEAHGFNEFKTLFFDNDSESVIGFLESEVPKVYKAKIGVAQQDFINLPFMRFLKMIILDERLDVFINRLQVRLGSHNIIKDNDRSVSGFMIAQYEKFRKSKSCILYVRSLNGQVCSYCDKGIIDCTDSHFYGDLDHIYDKSTYYYLALNISNLTPCCKVCNQLKGVRKVSFNPITQQLDDIFNFYIDDNDLRAISSNLSDSVNIELKLRQKNDVVADILFNLNEVLSLSDRYKNCGHVVNHLMQLKRVYTQNYINDVEELIGSHLDSNELKNLLLGIYSRNSTSKIQPLTKLVYDLSAQIDLFDEG